MGPEEEFLQKRIAQIEDDRFSEQGVSQEITYCFHSKLKSAQK